MKIERLWTALVNIQPIDNLKFNDLIEVQDDNILQDYDGAWAKVLVKEPDILKAYNTIIAGFAEKNFIPVDFEYLDDFNHYKDSFEVDDDFVYGENLLNESNYKFCIVGRIFPYHH